MGRLFPPEAGAPVDLAPFGVLRWWSGSGARGICGHDPGGPGPWAPMVPDDGPAHLGVEWDEPRDVAAVVFRCAPDGPAVGVTPRLEYWQHNWPWPHRDLVRGAQRGWTGRDDAFHGDWRIAAGETVRLGDGLTRVQALPLDYPEVADPRRLHDAEDFRPAYRRTLKVRLAWDRPCDLLVEQFAALAPATWARADLEVWRFHDARRPLVGPIVVRIVNGHLADRDGAASVEAIIGDDAPDPVRIGVLHTGHGEPVAMSTTVSLETPGGDGAAVSVADVLDRQGVWIPDLGLLVRPAQVEERPEATVARLSRGRFAAIHDRVDSEPEQTRERAFAETPRLAPAMQHPPIGRYVVLGHEGNRSEFAIRFNGNVFMSKPLSRIRGRDAVGLHWPGAETAFRFGTGDPPEFREREGDWVQQFPDPEAPVLETRWTDRGVEYVQTCLTAPVLPTLPEHMAGRGDEEMMLLVRFDMRSVSSRPRWAAVRMETDPPEAVELHGSILVATGRLVRRDIRQSERFRGDIAAAAFEDEYDWRMDAYAAPVVRAAAEPGGDGAWSVLPSVLSDGRPGRTALSPSALLYRSLLDPGQSGCIVFAIPFRPPSDPADMPRVGPAEADAIRSDILSFWQRLAQKGMSVRTGDGLVDDFYRATLPHVLITADRDPGSGVFVLPAATFAYGACGNEACLQIRQLDYRGYHRFAESCLEAFVITQGRGEPDGNFSSGEGWFQGIEVYDGQADGSAFGYNLDHGFILTCLAEHYLLTRDISWLRRVASSLVAGCDFVTRERQSTMVEDKGERSRAWGLLPAGHLEDNPEWRHWFAVNAHAHLGMRRCGQALADIGHPAARTVLDEAAAYRLDILEATRRARMGSPAARLADGTSVPHVPARTHLRGPDWGWFREAAYGSLHLVDGDVIDPAGDEAGWILRVLEDCAFVDPDLGRPVDLECDWFSHGGVTIQPNLLNNAVAYLRRGEIPHAVRAMFNTFALSLYPDVLAFTEHAVRGPGLGTGPYYKTPDECGFLNTLRHFLVHEEGDELQLGRGIPRSWLPVGGVVEVRDAATWFGPVSYALRIEANRAIARITVPTRNSPGRIRFRIRRGDRKPLARVEVGGRPLPADAFGAETIQLPPEPGGLVEVVAATA